jgi:DNA-binding XRE family transcriptional regulator
MTRQIELKLRDTIIAVHGYYENEHSVHRGIIDVARLTSETINFLIEKNEIKYSERIDCCIYVCDLLNASVNDTIPKEHVLLMRVEMLKVQGYNLSIVSKIYSKLS